MDNYFSFAIPDPENYRPSGTTPFSRILNQPIVICNHNKREKNKFYFDDFYDEDILEHRRKYQNDWNELREFVDLDDIELDDNELVIINMSQWTKQRESSIKIYASNYNVLRIMDGMGGLSYSN